MDELNFEWVNFYMEFADKLLEYKNNHRELINIIVQSFDELDMDFPKIEADEDGNKIIPIDIDPFTIFALFNRQTKEETRTKITTKFKEKFSLNANVPLIYDGITVVNNLATNFYSYKDERGNEDIDNLWNLFECAIELSDNHENKTEFINYYNLVLSQKRVLWNITMGLFWIRPNYFISLDRKNREYLKVSNLFSEKLVNTIKSLRKPPEGELYLKICEYVLNELKSPKIEFKTIPELSDYAYFYNDNTEDDEENEGIGDTDIKTKKYWLYSPGTQAMHWDEFYDKGIMAIGWDGSDNLENFENKKEIEEWLNIYYNDTRRHTNDAKTLWQFANEVEIGDIIFVKRGVHNIIGRGVVTSDYIFDDERSYYKHVRRVDWKFKGDWKYNKGQLIQKTLTDITIFKEVIDEINSFFINEENRDLIEEENEFPEYSIEDFLEEAYIDKNEYNILVNLLKNKKNLIIQGAPGVGKTFIAKRLAYSIMGVKDINRVMMVQFHQSYSYEDFIMGFRPSKENFELKHGSFYQFCKDAEDDDENDYFFIIDEINRGNLSKIFGELFMLIEKDKRGEKNKIQLLYSEESFFIPKNLYIIGLMNTADRSLAMVDYALRRRFSFYDLKPGFASDGFKAYQENVDIENFNTLIDTVVELNEEIKNDESLGEGFVIGHSYFSNIKSYEQLEFIIDYEIIPLLKEYWFDEPDKVENWTLRLKDVIN